METLQVTKSSIDQLGGHCQIIRVDCSNLEEVQNSYALANGKFGPVDILINNAGIVSGKKIL
jgi:NADP-dependent 3-hydroxy acid dehydrogenase YdfG